MGRYLIVFLPLVLFAQQIDCNRIFEQRKGELIIELERIDEQKQSLEALKAATEAILEKKEKIINEREAKLEAMMEEIEKQKDELEALVAKNEELLDQIKNAKMDKISETYARMKPKSAAPILEAMELEEAVAIMRTLQPKVVGDIFARMDPQKASEITNALNELQGF